jgi:hypothetical protein
MYARVTDHPTLLRDMRNKHIVQTDTSVIRKHEMRLKLIEEKEQLKKEIATIKDDVQEIKDILKALITRPGTAGSGGGVGGYPLPAPVFPQMPTDMPPPPPPIWQWVPPCGYAGDPVVGVLLASLGVHTTGGAVGTGSMNGSPMLTFNGK